MLKWLIVFLIIFGSCNIAVAEEYVAIIYCNFRATETIDGKAEHWKPSLPDLGVGTVIRDHILLEKQGAKRVYLALVDTDNGEDGQVGEIRNYIRGVNGCDAPTLQGPTCSTDVDEQILSWWGRGGRDAYRQLWNDRATDPFFNILARRILRYRVEYACEIDGEPNTCRKTVSLADAVDVYEEVIDPLKVLEHTVFSGR